jgi:hypothetical protein
MARKNKNSIERGPQEASSDTMLIPLDRGQIARDFKQMIARIVEEKVSQAMSNHDSALLEPWFQSQEIETKSSGGRR